MSTDVVPRDPRSQEQWLSEQTGVEFFKTPDGSLALSFSKDFAMRFNCLVRAPGGTPFCGVADTSINPPALMVLPTPIGSTPFQVQRVRSAHPVVPVSIEVRFAGNPQSVNRQFADR